MHDGRPRHRSRHRQHGLRRRGAPRRAAGRARRRGDRDVAAAPDPARGSPRSTRAWARCSTSTRPDALAVEDLYFGANARSAFAVGQARGVVLLAAGQRGPAVLLLHAPAGQGRGLRLRPRRQGPGPADGPGAAGARRAAAARPRGRRARGRDLPRQRGAAARGARRPPHDRARSPARSPSAAPTTSSSSCGGVGYRLAVSAETLRHAPAVGKPATLHTHLIVRDDALQLYGFATEEERDLFLLLIGVQSVGPKVALAVLSGGTPRELLAAVAAGDTARLQAVPGIGKRTAERIVVELREKVGAAPADDPIVVARGDDPRLLARDGLVGLGFSPRRPSSCSTARRRRHARGPDRARAEGGAPVMIRTPGVDRSRRRTSAPRTSSTRRCARSGSTSSSARRRSRSSSRSRSRPRRARRRARPRAARRPARASARPPRPDRRGGARRPVRPDRRPGARAQGRHRRLPHRPRAAHASSSSTRSTGSRARWRRRSTPRWRTASCRSRSASGAGAKVVTLDLPPFTLIGATTRAGLLTTPLRDRFGIQHRLEHYAPGDLARIVVRSRAASSASRSTPPARARSPTARRGTPRVANRLLKRVRDFAQVRGDGRDRRDGRRRRAGPARGRPRGPRPAGPRAARARSASASPAARSASRRSPSPWRGGRHDRGRLRALPAAARLPHAHAARPLRHRARLPASRPRAARRATAVLEPLAALAGDYPYPSAWPICSSAPTAASRTTADRAHGRASATSRRAARSAASASSSSCSTTTTRRPTRRSSCATSRAA